MKQNCISAQPWDTWHIHFFLKVSINTTVSVSSFTHALLGAVTALRHICDALSSVLTSQTDSIYNWNGNYLLSNAETWHAGTFHMFSVMYDFKFD